MFDDSDVVNRILRARNNKQAINFYVFLQNSVSTRMKEILSLYCHFFESQRNIKWESLYDCCHLWSFYQNEQFTAIYHLSGVFPELGVLSLRLFGWSFIGVNIHKNHGRNYKIKPEEQNRLVSCTSWVSGNIFNECLLESCWKKNCRFQWRSLLDLSQKFWLIFVRLSMNFQRGLWRILTRTKWKLNGSFFVKLL